VEGDEPGRYTFEAVVRWAGELKELEARLGLREQVADDRDAAADERDRVADERDRVADRRETLADRREKQADERELQLIAIQQRTDELARTMGLTTVTQYRRALEHITRARARLQTSSGQLDRSEAAIERGAEQDRRAQAEIDREIASTKRHEAETEPTD